MNVSMRDSIDAIVIFRYNAFEFQMILNVFATPHFP